MNPKAWHVLRSIVVAHANTTGVGLKCLTTRVGTNLVPLARQTIQIGRTPTVSPLLLFLVAWSGSRALSLGSRGGQTFALSPSCRQTFATAIGCTEGRTSGLGRPYLGCRTYALALRGGQSIGMAGRTTGWRRLGVVGLGSGVAGLGSRNKSGTFETLGGTFSTFRAFGDWGSLS